MIFVSAGSPLLCQLSSGCRGGLLSGCPAWASRAVAPSLAGGLKGLRGREAWAQSTGPVAVGLSRSEACGVFLDQGWSPCLLHWQVDSLPLSRQRSPDCFSLLTDTYLTSKKMHIP